MLPDHRWILSVLLGINVSSGLELWQKHTSVVSTVQCHHMGVSQTDAKNDATARERGTFLHHEREIQNGF